MTTAAELQAKLSIDAAEYLSTVKKVEEETSSMAEHISKAGELVKSAFEFFAVAEFTKTMIEFAHAGAEAADQIDTIAQKTGESAEQVQQYAYAARMTGTAQDALVVGTDHLSKSMAAAANGTGQQADAFRAMGISVTDAHGKLRPLNDVLGDVADKFESYKDGPAKAALAMILFGKSGTDLIPLLNKGSEGLRDYAAEAKALGVVLDKETIEKANQTGVKFKQMDAVMASAKTRIAADLFPSVSALSEEFGRLNQEGSLANTAMTAIEGVFKLGASAAIFLAEQIEETGNDLGAFAAQAVAVAHLEFGRSEEIGREALDRDHKLQQEAADTIAKIWADNSKKIADSKSEQGDKGDAPGVKAAKDAKAAYAILSAEMQAALNLEKEVDRERQAVLESAYKTGEVATRDYYAGRLAIEQAGMDQEMQLLRSQIAQTEKLRAASNSDQEKAALQLKLIELNGRLQLAEQKRNDAATDSARNLNFALEQQDKVMRDLAIDAQAQLAKGGLDLLKTQLNQERTLRQISAQQYLEDERKIEDQAYQIEVQRQQARLANLKGTDDEIARQSAQINAQLQQLEIQHQRRLTEIDNAAVQDRTKYAIEAQQAITSSVEGELAAVMENSKSAQKAFHDLMNSILKDIDQMAAKRLVENLFGAGTGGGGALSQLLGMGGAAADGGTGASSWGTLFASAPGSAAAGGSLGDWFGSLFGGASASGVGGDDLDAWASSVFGGAYADGGNPPLGKISVVGENGTELFVPNTAGHIFSNDEFKNMMGGGPQITQNFTVMAPNGRIASQTDLQLRTTAAHSVMEALRRS